MTIKCLMIRRTELILGQLGHLRSDMDFYYVCPPNPPITLRTMKKVLVVLAAAAFVMTLPSCKKCSTCKYTYDFLGTQTTYTYPETCGKKKDVEAYEDACAAAATLAGGSCTCDKS